MSRNRSAFAACAAIILAGSVALSGTVSAEQAQVPPQADAASSGDDIIVTARKRQESILNVPVVETAITQQTLEHLQVQDLKDIASLVPGLSFGDNVLSVGTQVSLRGVGTSSNDPGVDQSVSLNVDGLSLSNGLAFGSGSFDLAQVEVLKGPQALFYGKSSPGGVISFRTVDPTDVFEVVGRAAYEAEAREKRTELIVSGPLSNTLKARIAGFYSDQDGFFENIVRGPLPAATSGYIGSDRLPGQTSWMIRGTLLWNPASDFSARLKINTVHDRTIDSGALQLASCPTGVGPVYGLQFENPAEDCHLDRKISLIEMSPAAFPELPAGGLGFTDTDQNYGTLELNYTPAHSLTLTSTSALYFLHSHSTLNATASSFDGPTIGVTNNFRRREVTEELRLNSDYAGPLNFTAGGFLERGRVFDDIGEYGSVLTGFPAFLAKGANDILIKTGSLFGQLRYRIIPAVELAAGARWTDETRTDDGTAESATGVITPVILPTPRINSKNVAPEITLTYRPKGDLTLFGSWKQAYKSGSYSIGTPPVAGLDNAFHDEKVTGGEIGLKSRLFDRRLTFNLSAYDYRYSGLQVGAVHQIDGGIPIVSTVNAGAALVRGVEAEFAYRPPQIDKLTLHGDINYNHARFKTLDAIPCYGGQTIADGCTELFSPTANDGIGGFTAQDASGLPLVRSAKWQANFGFDWELPIGRSMALILANAQQYSARMLTNLSLPFYQPAFIKTDLSATLRGPDDRWEVALIGKNLSNEITTGSCVNLNGRAAALPGTQQTGTTTSGLAGHDQVGCYADRGREAWIRLTLRPFR